MKQCKIYGLTGGIASGKSTVSKYLTLKGHKVIDADKIAHEITNKGEEGYYILIDKFGKGILDNENKIDRKKLGEIVFNDKNKLFLLNSLLHPIILKNLKKDIDALCKVSEIIFLDIPLLFEEYDNLLKYGIVFDKSILVYVNFENQIKRLIQRDNITNREATNKINAQISLENKKELADYIIDNNSSIETLYKNVDLLISKIEG